MQDLSSMSTEELLRLRAQRAQQQAPNVDPRIQPSVASTQASTRQTEVKTRVDEQTAPTTVATNALPDGYRWIDPANPGLGVEKIPGFVEKPSDAQLTRDEAEEGRMAKGDVVKGLMSQVIDLYKKDIKGQPATRLFGALEYFNTPRMQRFSQVGEASLPLIRGMIARSAKEGDSNTELEIFRTYIPKASDSDLAIEQKLRSMELLLRGLVDGVPPSQSLTRPAETPLVDEALGFDRDGNRYVPPADPPKAAGAGATEAAGVKPKGFDARLSQLQNDLYTGRINLEDYARGRVQLDGSVGEVNNAAAKDQYLTYLEEAYQLQQLFEQGARPQDIPAAGPPTRDLSNVDQFRNNLAASPLGTGFTNLADAGSLGALSLIAGDQMQAANELNPTAATVGQIGGAIAGTAGLGSLGRMTLAQRFPTLMGGGARGQFARNVGTDIAYGTAYGTNTGMDAGDAALSSTVGSVGGNLAGKLVGKAVGGVNVDPAVDYLRNRNIPLTTGQTLGGMAKGIEDRMAGLPFIGDMVGQRRLEGLQAFNREAFDEAGRPIGFTSQRIGAEGLADLQGAQGQAYDAATAGFRAPIDMQYGQDLLAVQQAANRLPPDALPAFEQIGENYVMPIVNAGEMTGDIFQNTQRALKMKRNSPPTGAQGFEQEWKDAVTTASDANRNFVTRVGGNDVVQGLDNADQSYRLGKVVQDATERAKGGSQSGEVRTFTPSQLQMANQASARSFPGANPLVELADQGQRVLPSTIPDSGTAGRLAALALPGAVAGGGAGLGFAAGGTDGAQSGAVTSGTLAAALMLLGTKQGQKALNAALVSRPKPLSDAVKAFNRNQTARALGGGSGIFGRITLMPSIESSR